MPDTGSEASSVYGNPKQAYIRSPALLKAAEGVPCMVNSEICNHDPATSVAAHSEWHEDGKAGKLKAHDIYICIACSNCHDYIDNRQRVGQTTLERRDAFHRGMKRTWELFVRAGLIRVEGFNNG